MACHRRARAIARPSPAPLPTSRRAPASPIPCKALPAELCKAREIADSGAMLAQRRNLLLACALSALAVYVDGIGFLHLGGLFVSFMSGNSTRMGVSLADGNWSAAGEALGLIVLFVAGAGGGQPKLVVR